MSRWLRRLARFSRSLYARIALVYLTSLLLLSVAAAWIAVSQFDQLGRELQQRMQIGLAQDLARIMRGPLRHGPRSGPAREAARRIVSINPSLSLYVLDARGRVVGDYAGGAGCKASAAVPVTALKHLLGPTPMLPVFVHAPCSGKPSVFSVARIDYGPAHRAGFLFAVLDAGPRMSMFSMLRTSSITRTLIAAGALALLISSAVGLLLFALLTRRFSRLTQAVQRLAGGDYSQRIDATHDDEIGRLGQAFNDMAATIEAQLGALRENDRQRRDLVANLSHDFRTPLTSLRGYAEKLRDDHDQLPRAQRDAHLAAIVANTERLTRLARQLSTLTRVDAFESALAVEAFSVAELAHDVTGKFQPQARAAGLTLGLRCEQGLGRVRADLGLIDRALTNLVENALHATRVGGRVEVAAARDRDRVRITVTDSGIGLDPQEQALVTQRFYRTAAGRAARDGTGLGLSIVAEICERHGTRLVIASRRGQGTRMMFDLPAA